MVQKLIGINGYDLEIPISTHMAFFAYEDRPGVIGAVGKLLGEADVNIAGMQVSRDDDAAKALIALTVDQAIPRRRRRRDREGDRRRDRAGRRPRLTRPGSGRPRRWSAQYIGSSAGEVTRPAPAPAVVSQLRGGPAAVRRS